ncbi:MAG: flagella basal body P-ring formation protein FlgA [Olsenella sp.]|jgi:pilus assembly protein CpaB|nr:flagella basal body P-ring formation protein FlgA [Olsenella sp.]MCI1792927.1 flagella basal body P-ring formation protein FlgA [Olsenella sp.]MCI1811110.1 flagella basal body P-ring formation protein FlgA [Olsenella sp.]MCI1878680.1 flagella basal body P-ring formation protein FlgA [Olsenella sp.]MCI2123161.1 flagella basal body P-ring formation protein FlgA [Olsenella sp.]
MPRRFKIVLSAAFAVLAIVLCLAYGESVRAEEKSRRQETLARYGGEVVELVVATTELEEGQVVSAGDVARRDWVSDLVPEGAITNLDDAVGKKVMVAIASGSPLTQLNFRETGTAVDVPSGTIAVSLPMGEKLGVGEGVSAGSRLVAYRVADGVATVLAKAVTVLSIPEGAKALSSGSQAMTVALDPGDVSAVLAASTEGSLRFGLPADDVKGVDAGVPAAPTKVDQEGSE